MSAMLLEPDIIHIRQLNDRFRSTFVGGAVYVTPAVEALEPEVRKTLLEKVRAYSAFDHKADPFEEHDFGELTVAETRFFWKIDCYDRRCKRASPDPCNPDLTTRVLTILRADEH